MEVSGEVADLLVREGLQVAELAAKLSGKGIVNAAVLIAALIKNNYKVVGKVGVDRLNRENTESVIIPIEASRLPDFEKLAKQFGVLYAAVKQDGKDVVHIISNVNYSAQLNTVLDTMGYAAPIVSKEEQAAKKAKARTPQDLSSNERSNGLTSVGEKNEKPSVRGRLAALDAVCRETGRQLQRERDKTR